MKEIWKFPLEITDRQTVRMPFGAEILCVQTQDDVPTLWACVETGNTPADVEVLIVGTGHSCSDVSPERYVGTVQMHDGSLVWHVFA